MPENEVKNDKTLQGELFRYILNGLVGTAVHFSALSLCLQIPWWRSAGLANLVAACFGITSSFIGNRYFVFRKRQRSIVEQGTKFIALYGALALLHGATLGLLTDLMKIDYRIGFLVAACLQFALSYGGNKKLVFKY